MIKDKNFKTKYVIKIPKNITVIHCDKTNTLVFIGPIKRKILKLDIKIAYINVSNLIIVSKVPIRISSKNSLKKLKKIQGTTTSKIKQALIETSNLLYQKLNLVGVGYRVFNVEQLKKKNQLCLKLGYSHLIYHKVPEDLNTFCVKFTKLFIFGSTSYENLTQTLASIRKCKLPEPYKGKGILRDQEKIILKKGKKI